MRGLYTRLMSFISVDHPSPGLKQLPLALAFVISIVILLVVPGIPLTSEPLAFTGMGLMILATVFAAIITTRPKLDAWAITVPLVDLVAIGLFRAGTGGILSLFGAVVILPVVWIATEKGRRYILVAAVGTGIVLLSPYLFGVTRFESGSDVVRATFSPLVYLFAAAIFNELARQSRAQLRSIRDLAEDKERMLKRTFEYASQLEESEAKYREADRTFRGVWAAVTEQSVIGTDITGLIDAWNPGATKLLGLDWRETQGKREVDRCGAHHGIVLAMLAVELGGEAALVILVTPWRACGGDSR